MNEFWAMITVTCAAITGIAAFILTLFQIRHLKLSIRQLELSTEKLANELAESRQSLYKPTLKEIEEYGRRIAEDHRNRLKQMAKEHADYLHSLYDLRDEVVKRTYKRSNDRVRMQEELLVMMEKQIEAMDNLHHAFVSLTKKTDSGGLTLETKM